MYGCLLGTKYIARNSSIVTDPHFESGVVEIQENHTELLLDVERETCF